MPAAALALALAPAIALPAAGRIVPGFAPPVDRPLAYEMVELREIGGRPVRFALALSVRFARAGAGYRLDITQTGQSTDAPPPIAAAFLAGVAGMEGVTTSLLVARDGTPGGVIDGDAIWARILDAHEAVLAAKTRELGPAAVAPLRAHFDAIAAADPATRDAMMGEWGRELLGSALPPLAPGESVRIGAAEVRLASATATRLSYRIDAGPGATTRERHVTIDRATGIASAIRIVSRAGGRVLADKRIALIAAAE